MFIYSHHCKSFKSGPFDKISHFFPLVHAEAGTFDWLMFYHGFNKLPFSTFTQEFISDMTVVIIPFKIEMGTHCYAMLITTQVIWFISGPFGITHLSYLEKQICLVLCWQCGPTSLFIQLYLSQSFQIQKVSFSCITWCSVLIIS